jgi:hypothetical protein
MFSRKDAKLAKFGEITVGAAKKIGWAGEGPLRAWCLGEKRIPKKYLPQRRKGRQVPTKRIRSDLLQSQK